MDKKLNAYTLVLYGGGDDISDVDNIVFGFLKKDATIFFSPSAKEYLKKQDEYFDFFRRYVNKFGSFNVEKLDLTKEHFDRDVEFIKNADMIYFGGGNSFLLNKLVGNSKLSVFLKKQKKSIVLVGYSAGAVIMGQNISPVQFMDERIFDAPKEGLGMVPWSIFPHYAANDEQIKFLLECAKNINIPIAAISNNCGLVCKGDECKVIGKGFIDMILPSGKIERFTVGSIISKSYGI